MRANLRLHECLWHQLIMRIAMLVALIFCIPLIAHADDPETHSMNSGAHTHGMAMLQVVMEEDILLLEIQSPAVNLLGFERQVQTTEQVNALQRTQKMLADADSLFQFNEGNCEVTQSTWDFSSVEESKDTVADKNGHDHGDSVGTDHADHKDQHRDQDQQAHKSEHRDLAGHYRYQCANPAALESMNVLLFDAFSGVEAVRVQWIVHGYQGAATLDANNRQVSFR
jgi:hypothetical protein